MERSSGILSSPLVRDVATVLAGLDGVGAAVALGTAAYTVVEHRPASLPGFLVVVAGLLILPSQLLTVLAARARDRSRIQRTGVPRATLGEFRRSIFGDLDGSVVAIVLAIAAASWGLAMASFFLVGVPGRGEAPVCARSPDGNGAVACVETPEDERERAGQQGFGAAVVAAFLTLNAATMSSLGKGPHDRTPTSELPG